MNGGKRGKGGAGLAAAAHLVLRLAVSARRDERRHALSVPIHSRPDERRAAELRSGEERPKERSVTAQRRRGRRGAAGAESGGGRGGGGSGMRDGCTQIPGGGGKYAGVRKWFRQMRLV